MYQKSLRFLTELTRTADWAWKLPPLLALAFAFLLIGDYGTAIAFRKLALIFLVCGPCAAAYGHLINDIFDLKQDLAVGKRNHTGKFSAIQKALLCLLFILVGFIPLWVYHFRPAAIALLFVEYLMPTLYSVPPIRFKERGGFGVIVDAMGAHAIPVLFIVAVFMRPRPFDHLNLLISISAFIWAFFLGLRNIVIHQNRDRSNDLRTGTMTFGAKRDPETLRRLVIFGFLPFEVMGLTAFTLLLFPFSAVLIYCTGFYLLAELTKVGLRWKWSIFNPEDPEKELYVPLLNNEFYELWLPLGILIQLIARDPLYVTILLFYLFLFYWIFIGWFRVSSILLKAVMVRLRRIKRRMRMRAGRLRRRLMGFAPKA